MTTKYDNFYGGHVEMDGLGFQGTPVDDRVLSDEQLASAYAAARAIAELMDRLDFDTLWLAEHHFQHEGYGSIPNVPMLAVYLAQHTERLNFGAWFNTAPAWHPLRLAEEFAMADVLTGGRFRFGVGRGYIAKEVETLGSPLVDDDANRALFEEQLEVIRTAFGQRSFSHRGEHYDLPARVPFRGRELQEITLVPRPLHRPVEVWQPIQSGTQRGYDFMAKHGIKGVVAGGTVAGGKADKAAASYRDALARTGRDVELGEDLAISVNIHMADTTEKAIREVTPYQQEVVKVIAPLGRIPHLTEEQVLAANDPARGAQAGLPTIQQGVDDGTWICGPPEHVIERIAELKERLPGLERLSIGAGGLGIPPRVMREDVEWFGVEVLPVLREASATDA